MEGISEKERLLDQAIYSFALEGFEAVPPGRIAEACGLEEADFYAHFEDKQNLLDAIYGYYEAHYFANVRPLEAIRPTLQTGTAEEIIRVIAWNFYGMPEEMHRRMTSITKIVYARFLADDRANSIFTQKMTQETIEDIYIKLEALKGYGRLRGEMDLLGFAEMIVYSGLMTGIVGLSNHYRGGLVDNKMYLKDMLADFLRHNLT